MKIFNCLLTVLSILSLISPSQAVDHVTLVAETTVEADGQSESITLRAGEFAELLYCSCSDRTDECRLRIEIGEHEFEKSTNYHNSPYDTYPIKVAGPATVRLQLKFITNSPAVRKVFATLAVTRVGMATGPVPIPAEAGTTWQVVLESSSDLVNWSPVMPGNYPSSTPQRYFRTRLVRQ